MNLIRAASSILSELIGVLSHLSDAEYSYKIPVLNGSTLGQHVRHILEFFTCLNEGYFKGIVNYDKRNRNREIEENRDAALREINKITQSLKVFHLDHLLLLEMSYDPNGDFPIQIETNYQRELAYNIEHSVHHMALIRIGVQSIASRIPLSNDFGVAVSTIRHQNKSN